MKRIVDVDMTIKSKKLSTALNRFFKKYPELNYWRESFEYMAEHNEDFESNNIYNDGSRNNDWTYALHLDIEDSYFYIAVIERA